MKQTPKTNLVRLALPFAALFCLLILSGCLTPRKMDKWIDTHYGKTVPAKLKSNDYITVKTEKPFPTDRVSQTVKGQRKMIPALVYWQWDYANVSALNPAIPAANLSTTVVGYANGKGLRQKVNGQKIELTVNKLPAGFSLREKGTLIYVLVYYIGWEHIFIEPGNDDLVVTYRLLKDDVETKKGIISIPNRGRPVSLKVLQSTKKMTWRYLDQYNENIRAMSRELVDKLLTEIGEPNVTQR